MIKALIDFYFAGHYHLGREVTIDESHTSERKFDLDGTIGACILPFGAGQASFSNESQQDISVLDYEGYINKYSGTKFYMGRGKCDCILESESVATVVLNEITSSVSGMGNLTLPIFSKKGKTYSGGKFEKAEYQLLVSLQTLLDVPHIAAHLAKQTKRVCLCSYKLYTSKEQSIIGNPVAVFGLGQSEAERQTGEDGVKISCPDIESLGFEYRRISHCFSFSI